MFAYSHAYFFMTRTTYLPGLLCIQFEDISTVYGYNALIIKLENCYMR